MLKSCALTAIATCACCVASNAGEVLYNGIRLPGEWPPRLSGIIARYPDSVEAGEAHARLSAIPGR